MNWITRMLSGSIGRKLLMAKTGLFLSIFLIVHLIGNLQLLYADGGAAFNQYAVFMTTFGPVKIVSYLLYFAIIAHAVEALLLTRRNAAARPAGYAYSKVGGSSTWASRSMGVLGTVLLIFIVIHMKNFWFEMHFGAIQNDAAGNKDLYTVTKTAFAQWWYVAFYVLSMVALGYHLVHGFASAFQTIGVNHPKYTPLIKLLGFGFAVIVPAVFAAIPVIMFVQQQ